MSPYRRITLKATLVLAMGVTLVGAAPRRRLAASSCVSGCCACGSDLDTCYGGDIVCAFACNGGALITCEDEGNLDCGRDIMVQCTS